ncbi:MAG: cyanophycinase [Cyanobacteria bacterium J06627_8]
MLQLDVQPKQDSMPETQDSVILVIGGAEDKVHERLILSTFFQHSGAEKAEIAIIPCASREPTIIGDRYYTIFNQMGAKRIEILDIRERSESTSSRWHEFLDTCTGVFMTGGDQLRLSGLMADTSIMGKIRMRAQLGEIALAGTSAGAAVMGEYMIAGGGSGESPNRSLVDLADGLNIIPEIVVDQHFHNRNRMARLMSAVSAHPNKLGIGIDEDTCALFEGNEIFQVIGQGTVTVVDPGELTCSTYADSELSTPLSIHNLKVHVLKHGDRYNFNKRVVVNHAG